jgi:hypothetical protein
MSDVALKHFPPSKAHLLAISQQAKDEQEGGGDGAIDLGTFECSGSMRIAGAKVEVALVLVLRSRKAQRKLNTERRAEGKKEAQAAAGEEDELTDRLAALKLSQGPVDLGRFLAFYSSTNIKKLSASFPTGTSPPTMIKLLKNALEQPKVVMGMTDEAPGTWKAVLQITDKVVVPLARGQSVHSLASHPLVYAGADLTQQRLRCDLDRNVVSTPEAITADGVISSLLQTPNAGWSDCLFGDAALAAARTVATSSVPRTSLALAPTDGTDLGGAIADVSVRSTGTPHLQSVTHWLRVADFVAKPAQLRARANYTITAAENVARLRERGGGKTVAVYSSIYAEEAEPYLVGTADAVRDMASRAQSRQIGGEPVCSLDKRLLANAVGSVLPDFFRK